MKFEIVESSLLKVYKVPIKELAGLADHYYLAETPNLSNSVGWGAMGLELRGIVRINRQECERIDRFMAVSKYQYCGHF